MHILRSLLCVFCVLLLSCAPVSALYSEEGEEGICFCCDELCPVKYPLDDGIETWKIEQEDFEGDGIIVNVAPFIRISGSDYGVGWATGIYNNKDPVNKTNQFVDITDYMINPNYKGTMYMKYSIGSPNNDLLMYEKGTTLDFSATNLMNAITIYEGSNNIVTQSNWYYNQLRVSGIAFYDRVGNSHSIIFQEGDYTFTQSGDVVNLSFSVQVPIDTYKIRFDVYAKELHGLYAEVKDYMKNEEFQYVVSYGFRDSMFALTNSETSNSGFFSSILDWLKNIRDGIVNVKDGVSNLGSGITNVWNAIKNLPSQIWTYISDGLKNLFIPSEDDMVAIKGDWDSLLADRFGAIYEAGSLVVEWANNFQEQSAKDTISMPSVTVDLAGTPFTFGGYNVELVPARFDFLVDILRGVLDICCTLLFVNAMKKRYDNVVGGGTA